MKIRFPKVCFQKWVNLHRYSVGSVEAIAKLAADVVRTSPSHEAIAEWLRAVRLFTYYDAVKVGGLYKLNSTGDP